jgi:hypothetical protein
MRLSEIQKIKTIKPIKPLSPKQARIASLKQNVDNAKQQLKLAKQQTLNSIRPIGSA